MAENNADDSASSQIATVGSDNTVSTTDENGEDTPNPPPAAGQSVWGIIKTLGVRMLFIYFVASLFRRSPAPAQTKDGVAQVPSTNAFHASMKIDLYVYVSEQEDFTDFKNEQALFWLKRGLTYGDWISGANSDGTFTQFAQIPISHTVQNNGSLYIHTYFVKNGKSPDPADKGKYSKKTTAYRSKRLNRFKKRRFHTSVNLLTGQTDVHPDLIMKENSSTFEILSHWHPNLTINLLDDHSPWIPGSIPQPLDEYVEFLPGLNKYYPVIYFNEYWNLNTDFYPINDTQTFLNFSLTYAPISLFRWQLYAAQGMRNKWYNFMGGDMMEESDDDQDSLKTAFLETNPYLLGLTIVVSIAHSIFEFLAFKNDIQFWKSRKSLEGLSVRSVFFNVFQSLIIVLYVLDNETNTVVRISVFIGLLIEIWKIKKVVNVRIDMENKLFGLLPRVRIEDKSSYSESQTKHYDMLAFKYLSWLLFPLLVSYSIYSITYNEHRGWYSFVLSLMYGFLLTFGFIMMTPQLFINYKLKSVAHLPWRMLSYKALNTFIDDIFAFVIKMPTLYRIGCLRDDVIFFIFLYQRYIYSVDPSRVNEYGTSQEMFDDLAADKDGQEAITDGREKGDMVRENGVVKKEKPKLENVEKSEEVSEKVEDVSEDMSKDVSEEVEDVGITEEEEDEEKKDNELESQNSTSEDSEIESVPKTVDEDDIATQSKVHSDKKKSKKEKKDD